MVNSLVIFFEPFAEYTLAVTRVKCRFCHSSELRFSRANGAPTNLSPAYLWAAAETECNTCPIRYGAAPMSYSELSIEERATIAVGRTQSSRVCPFDRPLSCHHQSGASPQPRRRRSLLSLHGATTEACPPPCLGCAAWQRNIRCAGF